jgi:DNA-binding XRE family transcriptional regulator
MSFALPKPRSVGEDEVILNREDWDRLVEFLSDAALLEDAEPEDADDDADDIAAVTAARAEDAAFRARVEAERGAPVEVTIPIEVIEAKLEGAHPVRAWRNYRGWTQLYLSFKSDVGRDLIAQIETRKKNGSIETLDRLARALGVPMEALIEDNCQGGRK